MASNDNDIFGNETPSGEPDSSSRTTPAAESAAGPAGSGGDWRAEAASAGAAPAVSSAGKATKKAAKRAPRKTAKPAASAQDTSTGDTSADGDAPAAATKRAPRTAKRASRKTATKPASDAGPKADELAPTDLDVETEPEPDVPVDEAATAAERPAGEAKAEPGALAEAEVLADADPATQTSVVPIFGLLFQAPELAKVTRHRRATAPAAAPVVHPVHEEAEQIRVRDTVDGDVEDTVEVADQVADQGDGEGEDGGSDTGRRRRRRGGKGRRGRGVEASVEDPAGDGGSSEDETERGAGSSATGPEDTDEREEPGETGATRRRTRRRRRSGGGGDSDDPPGTSTRVREPRKDRDEITSVKGSTRLEAKKQRRREGREAGRRRTIITEAEFLARRESVERVMVVRHKDDRSQIAVLEDGVLVEHYVSRETNASMAGNVYLGRIQNVLPSMEAAFVDIGKGRNAVLYAGEVNWDAAGLENNRSRRIENALSSGQGVLVQVTKDPIGHKGARLTSQASLPGRYLVYVPDGNMTGISRKLPDTERARLKKILREIVPEKAGVIVRTAAEGASEDELRADVVRLTAAWEDIQAKSKSANAPALLHGEPDLTVRVIRDVFNEDFASLVVAGDPAWSTVSGYVNSVAPDLADRVTRWTSEQDLFAHYRVDEQIAKAMDRKVWLPSGGSLVIDRTEAMTVVDVNTGKFVGTGGNLEETVTKNNIEAAEEIVRQLRLRDIGGIIVIDFIDMVLESNRDLVVRRLLECLGRDRTKHQVAEVTSLGLVQMTRKRVGAGLIEVFSEPCEPCNGRGIIVSTDPIDRPAGAEGSANGADGSGSGNNRSSRGRRGRATGRDAAASTPAEQPRTHVPTGPTPAQIAAAAHAAAVHATSHEDAHPTREPAGEPEATAEAVEAGAADDAAAAAPQESVQVAEPAAESEQAQPTTQAQHASRGRRKRARVVAPAGPPRAAGQSSPGEFGGHQGDQVG